MCSTYACLIVVEVTLLSILLRLQSRPLQECTVEVQAWAAWRRELQDDFDRERVETSDRGSRELAITSSPFLVFQELVRVRTDCNAAGRNQERAESGKRT
jgi:hypothetical protein